MAHPLRELLDRIRSAIRGPSRQDVPRNRTTSRETVVDDDDDPLPMAPVLRGAPCLVVIYGAELGRRHVLEPGETLIGRAPASHIRLNQGDVAPAHATVTLDDRGIVIASHGPNAATSVNDRIIAGPTSLADGDLVKVGRTVFKLLAGENREGLYHDELFRLATTDDLTQVHNRSHFVGVLDMELTRSRTRGWPLSLLLVVPDHVEPHREGLGHRLHEHVLRELAALLREGRREADVVARYRDDTFAILLPHLDLHGASRLAEGLREAIERRAFALDDHRLDVTASIGVAELAPAMLTGDDLVDAADAGLRRADAAGGNRVASADPGDAPAPPAAP